MSSVHRRLSYIFGLRIVLTLLAMAAALLLPTQTAWAGVFEPWYVTSTDPSGMESMPLARVYVLERSGGRNYLFLPGCWDTAKLYAHLSGNQTISLQAKDQQPVPYVNHTLTDAFIPGSTLTALTDNAKSLGTIQVMQGSAIPCLFIDTETGTTQAIHKSRDAREPGQMVMYRGDGSIVYHGALSEIKGRGNTTFGYQKKPYQIKLDKSTDLLGTGKAKTWILLADYLDLSLLRNRITLDMARYAGMRYAIASQSVDLYINGNYKGVYLLTEKVQIHENRVDIRDMEPDLRTGNPKPTYPTFQETLPDGSKVKGYLLDAPPKDMTGGYLLEIDKAYRIRKLSDCYVFTAHGMGILVDEPEIVGKEQIYYLADLLTSFDRAVRQHDGIDPQTGRHYADIMDEESMAIKFLVEEISQNFDAAAGSQYFYKDCSLIDEKLYAGPGWDYDLTYGNVLRYTPSQGYLTESKNKVMWYSCLYQNQASFRQAVADLYAKRFRPALRILAGEEPAPEGSPLRSISDYRQEIEASASMNFIKWRPGSITGYNFKMGRSFDSSVSSLKRFVANRIAGLDRTLMVN